MRKNIFILLSFFVFTSAIYSQDIIENPAKPINPNAGRILNIQEVLRITDEGGEFYFLGPRYIKVAPDGTIFIYDREQLLRFDENGKFIHNFFKKGQGPGELNFVRNYGFKDGKLIVFNANPYKIVWFDFNGELLNDVKIHDISGDLRFQFLKDDTFYFFKSDIPRPDGKPMIMNVPQVLITLDQFGKKEKELTSFKTKVFATGGAWSGVSRLISVPYKNRYLFVSHTREYLVKLYDTEAQKTLRSFTRKYKRVKPPKDYRFGGIYGRDGKRIGPPLPEFFADISEMYIFKDLLWVRTSTKDEKKGYLIDVFNLEGKFIDSCYLNIDGRLISTHKDFIFVSEEDEDENLQIVIYKIIE
ncbi:MAG: 6-bladed beta-propeller [Candidatus Aminicenantes bacterium]|nr:MAG: 6-bladed beta-propeller [Candidatus Aminicenantes bacterium]